MRNESKIRIFSTKSLRYLHGVPGWFLLFFWGGGAAGVVDDDGVEECCCCFIWFWSSSLIAKRDAAEKGAAISYKKKPLCIINLLLKVFLFLLGFETLHLN